MTRAQIALIHLAKKQLGLDDATYRELLEHHGGVKSSRDLDPAGFRRVMLVLERLGFQSTSARKPIGYRAGFASDAQIDLIRGLWLAYAGCQDEPGLNRWLEKRFKVSALRFLPARTAPKVIEGLKAMASRPRTRESDRGPSAA